MLFFGLKPTRLLFFLFFVSLFGLNSVILGFIETTSSYPANGTDFLTFIPILLDTDGDGKNDAVELSCSASLSEGSYQIKCYFMDGGITFCTLEQYYQVDIVNIVTFYFRFESISDYNHFDGQYQMYAVLFSSPNVVLLHQSSNPFWLFEVSHYVYLNKYNYSLYDSFSDTDSFPDAITAIFQPEFSFPLNVDIQTFIELRTSTDLVVASMDKIISLIDGKSDVLYYSFGSIRNYFPFLSNGTFYLHFRVFFHSSSSPDNEYASPLFFIDLYPTKETNSSSSISQFTDNNPKNNPLDFTNLVLIGVGVTLIIGTLLFISAKLLEKSSVSSLKDLSVTQLDKLKTKIEDLSSNDTPKSLSSSSQKKHLKRRRSK